MNFVCVREGVELSSRMTASAVQTASAQIATVTSKVKLGFYHKEEDESLLRE